MQELHPLTISTSKKNKASVLMTKDYKQYILHQPYTAFNYVNTELFTFLNTHFKINLFRTGTFTIKGVKYLCSEEIAGCTVFNDWLAFQWKSKRQFNRFIQPKSLFYMYLTDLYFPVFGVNEKWVVPGKKDAFIRSPFPMDNSSILFKPIDINRSGLNSVEVKHFFRFIKENLPSYLEDFLALHHDKLRADLKYRISLHPSLRNEYWNEFQQCFQKDYRTYVTAMLNNYILQL
jgi:hypothetical protein